MAEQVTEYICPACGGPMKFDVESGKVKCDYCASIYEIEEVKNNYDCVTTIKMIRPNFENELTSEQRKHYTEVAMDNYSDYSYEVVNDKDISSLSLVATRIIDEVMGNES